MNKARVIEDVVSDRIPWDELFAASKPVVMPGLAANWSLVKAGLESAEQAMKLMAENYAGKPATACIGGPETRGRFAYDETCTSLNFTTEKMNLLDFFQKIRDCFGKAEHPYYYVNSLKYEEAFPGLLASNDLTFNHEAVERMPIVSKIWIGTESRASAHYDLPSNLSCCLVGRRRFTLFAPDQVHNLYPGPFNPTPGGQVITTADLKNPDFDTYPRLRDALATAITVDMKPGDALYYPNMWWHEVEATGQFNVMVNYWWYTSPRSLGDPVDVLMHAILGLRDRTEPEKQGWRELFDYYIFGPAERPREHLPEACHGVLGELDETAVRRLRALVQRSLNR